MKDSSCRKNSPACSGRSVVGSLRKQIGMLLVSVCLLLPTILLAEANQEKGTQKEPRGQHPDHIKIERDRPARKAPEQKDNRQPAARGNVQHFLMNIKVTLGDGRVVSGRLPVDAPPRFTIQHTIDGIQYEKEIQTSQLRRVEIKSWSGRIVGERKDGQVYEFRPDRYEIQLEDTSFSTGPNAAFAFLNQFPVYNANGRVYLFSFWRDLQRPNGSWFTGMPGPIRQRRVCHADVVRSITIDSVQRATRPQTKEKQAQSKK